MSGTGPEPGDVGVTFRIVNNDVLKTSCDVAVIKYSQALDGLGRATLRLLEDAYPAIKHELPKPGDFGGPYQVPTSGDPAPSSICFVGVTSPTNFLYPAVEEFGSRALATVAGAAPLAETLGMTLLGQGYGLDELACFDAQMKGMLSSLRSGDSPRRLREVLLVEWDPDRAQRLGDRLAEVGLGRDRQHDDVSAAGSDTLAALGRPSRPTAFVAMPFRPDFTDVFRFGIQQVLHDLGYKCERMDRERFLGDVLAEITRRISRSTLVVADLSSSNPNVYLEVGYAWASARPTVLLFRPTDAHPELEFDTRGQRCLFYTSITELREKLEAEISDLRGQGLIG